MESFTFAQLLTFLICMEAFGGVVYGIASLFNPSGIQKSTNLDRFIGAMFLMIVWITALFLIKI